MFRSRDKTWDERAGCYYRNRDFHRDTVKPSGDETTVVKSHHPFLGPQADNECISAIFKSTRHLLSNYFAWVDYLLETQATEVTATNMTEASLTIVQQHNWTLSNYAEKWAEHHKHWREYAAQNNIPLLEWRYEDMCSNSVFYAQLFMDLLGYEVVDTRFMTHHWGRTLEECWEGRMHLDSTSRALVSREEAQEVLNTHGEQLRAYGYADSMWVPFL